MNTASATLSPTARPTPRPIQPLNASPPREVAWRFTCLKSRLSVRPPFPFPGLLTSHRLGRGHAEQAKAIAYDLAHALDQRQPRVAQFGVLDQELVRVVVRVEVRRQLA